MASPAVQRDRSFEGWVDVAKTFGIFLVVLGHLPKTPFMESFFWTFHVPLFFFIAGYLGRPDGTGRLIHRVVFRLLVPYFVAYSALTLLNTRPLTLASVGPVLLASLYGSHAFPGFVAAPLWFLPSLATVEVMAYLFAKTKGWIYPWFLTASVLLFANGMLNQFLSIDLSLLGFNYYLAGLFARRAGWIGKLAGNQLLQLLLMSWALAVVIELAFSGSVWYAGSNYWLSAVGAFAGIAMMICMAFLLERLRCLPQRLVKLVSKNTLFILCYHGVSSYYVGRVLDSLIALPLVPRSVVIAMGSVACLLPICVLVSRWLPWVVGEAKRR